MKLLTRDETVINVMQSMHNRIMRDIQSIHDRVTRDIYTRADFQDHIRARPYSMSRENYDYTFNNQLIKKYFEGDNSYLPSHELLYLHTHPLIVPNFMTELSEMIIQAGKAIKDHKLGVFYTDKLTNVAIKIGQALPAISGFNAHEVLAAMREAYQLCKDLSSLA